MIISIFFFKQTIDLDRNRLFVALLFILISSFINSSAMFVNVVNVCKFKEYLMHVCQMTPLSPKQF